MRKELELGEIEDEYKLWVNRVFGFSILTVVIVVVTQIMKDSFPLVGFQTLFDSILPYTMSAILWGLIIRTFLLHKKKRKLEKELEE